MIVLVLSAYYCHPGLSCNAGSVLWLKYFFKSVTFLRRNFEVMLYSMIMGKFIWIVGTQACMSCVCEIILVSKRALGTNLSSSLLIFNPQV